MPEMLATLAELQAHVGPPARRGATYFAERGADRITAWTDTLAGAEGWWWAVHRSDGPAREVVLAMGFVAGNADQRDREIARRIVALREEVEASS